VQFLRSVASYSLLNERSRGDVREELETYSVSQTFWCRGPPALSTLLIPLSEEHLVTPSVCVYVCRFFLRRQAAGMARVITVQQREQWSHCCALGTDHCWNTRYNDVGPHQCNKDLKALLCNIGNRIYRWNRLLRNNYLGSQCNSDQRTLLNTFLLIIDLG
jgi:hypothetical protein